MNDPTEMLADRSRCGDRTAFEMLVRQTARGIYAHLLLKTGDPHQADDLTQETYLLAWKRVSTLRDPKAFIGWLRTIADATVIDAARKGTRLKRSPALREIVSEMESRETESREGEAPAEPGVHRRIAPGSAGASPSRGSPNDITPVDSIVANEEQSRALTALRELPETYRLPLTLRYLDEADYDTIARQLAISNGSLRGLLQRGMTLLREKLGAVIEKPVPASSVVREAGMP